MKYWNLFLYSREQRFGERDGLDDQRDFLHLLILRKGLSSFNSEGILIPGRELASMHKCSLNAHSEYCNSVDGLIQAQIERSSPPVFWREGQFLK